MLQVNKCLAFFVLIFPSLAFAASTEKMNNKQVGRLNNTIVSQNNMAKSANRKPLLTIETSLRKLGQLNDDYQFTAITNRSPLATNKHVRYQQYYKNIPIWGKQVVVHFAKKNKVEKLSGSFATMLTTDLANSSTLQPTIDETSALIKLKKYFLKTHSEFASNSKYSQENIRQVIYLNDKNVALLAYHVSYFIQSPDNHVYKPAFIIDANSGSIIKQWNDLKYVEATGPGGNTKVGAYEYGTDFNALNVTQSGTDCAMENSKVKTVDLNHDTSGNSAFSFPCSRNTHKEINGAYSPLNDAHAFGNAIYDMYNSWYNADPLSFQLVMRVHYGNQYENAFWDGQAMTFGDGDTRFYPLVSLDISAHEVAHGITEQNSGLIYSGQSGGINEAFSDMSGEAAEFYLRGSNDWLSGADVFKGDGALRYYEDPTLDGRSIGHADDFYSGMDVHYSSGVFNRAFFLLANTNGWDVRQAYDVMFDANRNYWTESTDYIDGACGAINASHDLTYNVVDVIQAFQQVGIVCDNLPFVDEDEDGMSDFWEQLYGLDASDASDAATDLDSDGLSNFTEYQLGTLPNNTDSDNDNLSDGDEINIHNTDPIDNDSDNDDLTDDDEVNTYGTNPNASDSEDDGMPDGWEVSYSLNPLVDDSALDYDHDQRSNLLEYTEGTDPTIIDVLDSEPNNDSANAQNIDTSFTLSYSANIGNETTNTSESVPHTSIVGSGDDSHDFYEFTIDSASSIATFDIDNGDNGPGAFDSYIRLFNANGELLSSNDDNDESYGQGGSTSYLDSFLTYTFETPATYYLKVSQFNENPIPTGATYILHVSIKNPNGDLDEDGMPNYWENMYGLNATDATDANFDNDEDGLTNLAEFHAGTNPINNDTDDDSLPDGWEINQGLNPLDSTDASLDRDLDGLSELQEYNLGTDPLLIDTDNDGVYDSEDSSPLDASTGSNIAPVFAELSALVFEATAELSELEIPLPSVTDNNINAPVVELITQGPYALGNHNIEWLATDDGGNSSRKMQVVTVVDTTGPVFNDDLSVEIASRGLLTDVSQNLNIIANDLVNGDINAEIITATLLAPGTHTLTLTAEDSSGNTTNAQLSLEIMPQVQLPTSAIALPNSTLSLPIQLNGKASKAVAVAYQITGIGAENGTFYTLVNSNNNPQVYVDVVSSAQVGDQFQVLLVDAENAVINEQTNRTIVDIINENIAPKVSFNIQQNDMTTTTISKQNGIVTIALDIVDLNYDSVNISWQVDSALINTAEANTAFSFDPITIAAGIYPINVVITENSTYEKHSILVPLLLNIQDNAPILGLNDSDNDGISDLDEGFTDSDNDGIANYLDDNNNRTLLPLANSAIDIQTVVGTKLSLGRITQSAQGFNAKSAEVSQQDIALYGAQGQATDNSIDVHYSAISPIVNINIASISADFEQAVIVIPLTTEQVISEDAIYRKYIAQDGWFDFIVDTKNTISSTSVDLDGNCPLPNATNYITGLSPGHTCIQLHIEDGGPNDTDKHKNGYVEHISVLSSFVNQPAIIRLTENLNVNENSNVIIDASESTDPDNDTLTFTWLQTSGQVVDFTGQNSAKIEFTAPEVDTTETISFTLTVSDSFSDSTASANVSINNIVVIVPDVVAVEPNNAKSSGGSSNTTILSWLVILLLVAKRKCKKN